MTSQKDIELMNKFYKEMKLENNIESIKKLVQIITPAPYKLLFDWLIKLLEDEFGYKTVITSRKDDDSFIFAAGKMPICAVAHLDTVHRQNVRIIQEIECLEGKNNVLTSPQGIGGDDRCGVIAIIILLLKGYRPSVFFPCGEEIGGRGTNNFLKNAVIIKNNTVSYSGCYPKASQKVFPKINWFIEIDRKGNNDVVHYSDSNLNLTKKFEKIGGFKENFGSFTDISHLMPEFGVSGVNISSAYYKAHTTNEYIVPSELVDIINRISKVFDDEKTVNTKFEYKRENRSFADRNYGYESIFGHAYSNQYSNQKESMMRPFGGHDIPMTKKEKTTYKS